MCLWRLVRIESPDVLRQELVHRSQEAIAANRSHDIATTGLQFQQRRRPD
jgi:hypothetical protein